MSSALCCGSAFAILLAYISVGWKHSTISSSSPKQLVQLGVGVKLNHQTQFCTVLGPHGPDEIVEVIPMPYGGETGSDTPRLHQAVPLQCCAEADQSVGKYSTGHDTVELMIAG